jgi:mannose-6-phosphate isomerase-like protein (cupin superfamily)
MSKPYKEEIKNGIKYREFDHMVETDELVWHRDKRERTVTVLEGEGWFFQMDNEIPKEMKPGDILEVKKMEYHRLYKAGTTPLKISIKEKYMKSFKQFNEAKDGYIGKTVVYATKDTSGGGTTNWTAKSKVVKHDKKYGVLTLADGGKVNIKLNQRKDKKLYWKKDFYIESAELEEAKGSTIDQIKAIIANKQRAKVGGKMIDLQTASIIAQIYDKVNSATKKKMENEKIDKLLKIASMVMKKESTDLEEADGWIAIFKGKKLEITKKDAKDLWAAKQFAINKLKVPKSKQGLLAIEPAYNESTDLDEAKQYVVIDKRGKVVSSRPMSTSAALDHYDSLGGNAKGYKVVATDDKRIKESSEVESENPINK